MAKVRSVAAATRKRLFFNSSGLEPSFMETKTFPDKLNRIYIVYRNPVTGEEMTTFDGNLFAGIVYTAPKTAQNIVPVRVVGFTYIFPHGQEFIIQTFGLNPKI